MKKLLLIVIILLLIVVIVFTKNSNYNTQRNTKSQQEKIIQQQISTMKIISSAFQHNTKIPSKYTCDGGNINPPLTFSETPQSAKSLILIVDDPDAPMGTWVHWVVYNIDPKIQNVAEHTVPRNGKEGMTSFGKPGYGGPCPPSGTHRYFFKLYALDTLFDNLENPDKKAIEEKMQGHIIDHAELIGLYSR